MSSPAFKEPVHVGRPNLPDRKVFDRYIQSIFNSRWLTNNGPLLRQFKEKLQAYLEVKNVIPVCNGTIALELAERALGFQREVVMPSYTFIATAHSLRWQQITPVFADIQHKATTLAPKSARNAITEATSGIIGVHVYGHPCDHSALKAIALERSIPLLYDAAHSFGCEVDGIPAAKLGDASVFSFHATKFFNTFEGGAITTDDDDLAEKVRLMNNFGFAGREKDKVDYLGINGKMSEISAAMGLAMLDSVESIRNRNRENYSAYADSFSSVPGLELIEPPASLTRNNWQYVIFRVNKAGITRDNLAQALERENILVRKYFHPGCHRLVPYCSEPSSLRVSLAETEALSDAVLSFPTGQAVNPDMIEKIANVTAEIIERNCG